MARRLDSSGSFPTHRAAAGHAPYRNRSLGNLSQLLADRPMRAILAFALLAASWAQPRYERSERLRSLQIAFLSEQMGLLPEEAQAFWPIYNAREAALQKNRQAIRDRLHQLEARRSELTPEAWRDSVSALYLQLWQAEADTRKAFHEQLKKAVPPEKVARFYLAELRLLRRALGEAGPPWDR